MNTKVNYTLVGLFVVILGTALVAAVWWLSFDPDEKQYTDYTLFFDESVSGLSLNAPVKFNGVEVGYIKDIKLHMHNITQVELLVAIEKEIPINSSTRAKIQMQGITGIAFIGLTVDDPDAPLLKGKKPHGHPVIPTEPSLLFRLDTAIRQITNNIDALTKGVGKLFDDHNVLAIQESLANTAAVTTTLANNMNAIQNTLQHSEKITHDAAVASEQLPNISKNIADLTLELKRALDQGNIAIQSLTEQAVPATVNNLDQLQGVLVSTQQLLQKVQRNPSVLLRGAHPPARGPGE